MPSADSYDRRKKAVEAVKRGQRKTDVCRLLQISRNTLDLWLKKEKETGTLEPRKREQKRENQKIKDEEKFREFLKEHHDKTQERIAELWGDNVTQLSMS